MTIRRSVETVSTSNADDAAFLALEDVARITESLDEIRVAGGQMASLLLTAFPTTSPTDLGPAFSCAMRRSHKTDSSP